MYRSSDLFWYAVVLSSADDWIMRRLEMRWLKELWGDTTGYEKTLLFLLLIAGMILLACIVVFLIYLVRLMGL